MPGERGAASTGGAPRAHFNGAPDRCPGRGRFSPRPRGRASSNFNGAPDRCPGRGTCTRRSGSRHPQLQWSPGQMPGESASDSDSGPRNPIHFNGAPDRCPGRGRPDGLEPPPRTATSMEPRTDARGELSDSAVRAALAAQLQWSPGQMPGERAAAIAATVSRARHFNGAPDRCPGRGSPLPKPR